MNKLSLANVQLFRRLQRRHIVRQSRVGQRAPAAAEIRVALAQRRERGIVERLGGLRQEIRE